MYITVEEAIKLIENSSKYEHSLLVSRIMKNLSKHFNTSEHIWVIVGLLHDLDYDHVTDFSQHGVKSSKQLENRLPKEAVHAIQSHDYRSEIKPETLLDEALIFADTLAGFLENTSGLAEDQDILKEKPWIGNTLIGFTNKHDLDVLELVEQLIV